MGVIVGATKSASGLAPVMNLYPTFILADSDHTYARLKRFTKKDFVFSSLTSTQKETVKVVGISLKSGGPGKGRPILDLRNCRL